MYVCLNRQISGEYTVTREMCEQDFTHVIVAVERSGAMDTSNNPLTECYLDNNYLAVPFTCDYSGKKLRGNPKDAFCN